MLHTVGGGNFVSSTPDEHDDVCMPDRHVQRCCGRPVFSSGSAVGCMCVVHPEQWEDAGLFIRPYTYKGQRWSVRVHEGRGNWRCWYCRILGLERTHRLQGTLQTDTPTPPWASQKRSKLATVVSSSGDLLALDW